MRYFATPGTRTIQQQHYGGGEIPAIEKCSNQQSVAMQQQQLQSLLQSNNRHGSNYGGSLCMRTYWDIYFGEGKEIGEGNIDSAMNTKLTDIFDSSSSFIYFSILFTKTNTNLLFIVLSL